MTPEMMAWIGFNVFILFMLALDLGVFHRKAHITSVREALTWSAVWVSLALLFNTGLFFWQGEEKAVQFLTGYLIEKSLSMDNVFIFFMIFSFFKVPELYQHKILFWGILGALILRAIMIGVGAALIAQFHWILYVFGAFLLYTGVKMFGPQTESLHLDDHFLVRLLRRVMPVTGQYDGDHFFTVQNGVRYATPMFLVLLVVEFTDVIFAVDSIPAIFAVTTDPFLVYTSNVFAILGLRSLYFALAGIVHRFIYLKPGLAIILVFVGIKMLLMDFYKIPAEVSLLVVVSILAGAIGLSWYKSRPV